MAIIQGETPANMLDVEGFQLPVDAMAKGLMARQTRADEVKNTVAMGDSALAIETRPFQEDMDVAKEVQSDYRTDFQKLLAEADGDYSKIDNSQVQSLATRYAADDRVRYLTSAKKNYDAALELERKIRASGKGDILFFGPNDPRRAGLKTADGNWIHMGDWDMESHLNYVAKGQELFKNLGHTLQDATGWQKGQGDWYEHWRTWWTRNKNNTGQIQHIIDNGLNMYKDSKEGKQYAKKKRQDLLAVNPNMDEDAIQAEIDKGITEMIFAIGKSQEIIENQKKENHKHIQPPKTTGGGGNRKGAGKDDVEEPAVISSHPIRQTFYGSGLGGHNSYAGQAAYIRNPKVEIENVDAAISNPESVQNIHALEMLMLGVAPGNGDSKKYGDKHYYSGLLMGLDNSLNIAGLSGDNNRALVTVARKERLDKDPEVAYAEFVNNDKLIIDSEDYIDAYKELYPEKSIASIKQELFGTSGKDTDAWTNTFSLKFDENTGSMNFEINPIYENIKEKLEEAAKGGDKLAALKLERLQSKIDSGFEFMREHKDELGRYEDMFFNLHQKATLLEKQDRDLKEEAGLSQDLIDDLDDLHQGQGKEGSYMGHVTRLYDEAEVEALSNYANSFSSWGRLAPTPKQDQGVFTAGNTSAAAPNYIMKKLGGRDKIQAEPDLANGFNAYMNVFNDALRGTVNLSEIKRVIGEDEFNKLLNKSYSNHFTQSSYIMGEYAEKLLESQGLFKDKEFAKQKDAIIMGISSVGAQFLNFEKDGDLVSYSHGKGFSEVEKQIKDDKKKIFEKKTKSTKTNIDNAVRKYLDLTDKVKEDYVGSNALYTFPGKSTSPGYADMRDRFRSQLEAAIPDEEVKVLRINFDRHGQAGGKPQPEEYNKDILLKSIESYTKIDENGLVVRSGRKEFWEDHLRGVIFDQNNPNHPFSAIIDIPENKELGIQRARVQVEVTPDPIDLALLGFSPLKYRFFNDIRKGLNANDQSHFDLSFNDDVIGNTEMRFFRAPFDIDGGRIKRGEFYLMSESGKPGEIGRKKVRVGTPNDAIDLLMDRVFGDANPDIIEQYRMMIKDGEKNPKLLNSKWQAPSGTTVQDVKNELKKYLASLNGGAKEQEETTDEDGNFNYTPSKEEAEEGVNSVVTTDEEGFDGLTVGIEELSDKNVMDIYTKYNPSLVQNRTINKYPDGKLYVEPKDGALVEIPYSGYEGITGVNVAGGYHSDIAGLISDLNSLQQTRPVLTSNASNVSLYLNPNEPIKIGSGRRSLNDNIIPYFAKLQDLSSSGYHLTGEAIDIMTVTEDPNNMSNLKLEAFFNTDEGKKLLKKHGLTVYVHSVTGRPGRHMHIDRANRADPLVYQKGFTPMTLERIEQEKAKRLRNAQQNKNK